MFLKSLNFLIIRIRETFADEIFPPISRLKKFIPPDKTEHAKTAVDHFDALHV